MGDEYLGGFAEPAPDWVKLLENEVDLSRVSAALNRESAIRSVMKIRKVGRGEAVMILEERDR
jgi:hypothetical protein